MRATPDALARRPLHPLTRLVRLTRLVCLTHLGACPLLAVWFVTTPLVAPAQEPALIRAYALEQDERYAEAAAAYRAALATAEIAPALLGLERAYAALGRTDSLVPLLDSLITARPRDGVVRGVQLRALQMLGRHEELRQAFDRWSRDVPRDPAPYREYARMLLQMGRATAADSVLQRAQRDLGSPRELYYEIAQLRAQLGLWSQSAEAWRLALAIQPFLDQAAIFALLPAPPDARAGVRQALSAPPATLAARRLLAGLELRWGSPRRAWLALSALPPDSASAAAWSDFARDAEGAGEWLAARDALGSVFAWRRTPEVALRAGSAALLAGDAAGALRFARDAGGRGVPAALSTAVLALEIEALSALGRAEEAERLLASRAAELPEAQQRRLRRAVAWGWIRAGSIERARDALAAAGEESEGDAAGWLALYEGDLGAARVALRGSTRTSPDAIVAMAILTRTAAHRAPLVGRAFLALARGDTIRAAREFASAADTLPDAASLLLATAARLHLARGDDASALPLWQRVAIRHEQSPEAAEANLEWARLLRRRGDAREAVARLEHLILTYPNSALVPQARRELELARNRVPATS